MKVVSLLSFQSYSSLISTLHGIDVLWDEHTGLYWFDRKMMVKTGVYNGFRNIDEIIKTTVNPKGLYDVLKEGCQKCKDKMCGICARADYLDELRNRFE